MTKYVYRFSDVEISFLESIECYPLSRHDANFWNDPRLDNIKKSIKDFYIKKQVFTCVYCKQRTFSKDKSTWDAEHIIPKDMKPEFLIVAENLCISCRECNREKSNKNVLVNKQKKSFPDKSKDYLIYHPHYDEYSDHIKKLSSGMVFFPKSKKGRKTIEVCGLLRFLYDYSDYGNVSLDLKKTIHELGNDLLNTTCPKEEYIVMTLIQQLSQKGSERQLNDMLDEYLE